ncbi:MAG: Gfo/Idh/MocA family oxidoreductase, partial [Chitinispirillaceae bacterium]|nr:Gfo/Idh/MocA family oxidoreductase [Chitinispirillaceae bacterium]
GVGKWYDNHHDLNHDPEVEAVIVTATTVNHKEIIIDAAAAGKAIFSEKPLTLNLADAREIETAVTKAGVFFQKPILPPCTATRSG